MFKRKRTRTPKEQAVRAQKNVAMRLVGCGLLIYFIVQLFRNEDPSMSPTVKIAVGSAMTLAAAVIIGVSIREFYISWKLGLYKEDAYAALEEDGEAVEVEETEETPELPEAEDVDEVADEIADDGAEE
ncbi:MAG: hypothetical protein LBN99_03100 [Oscillospiraceae bacterium]|jgi:hypothetical protein|nr:hypothetical protein [Oscillospiraceae bacterium]